MRGKESVSSCVDLEIVPGNFVTLKAPSDPQRMSHARENHSIVLENLIEDQAIR